MSGWDSRIKLRIDNAAAFKESIPTPTVNAGELAAGVTDGRVEIRLGVADGQSFTNAPVMMAGEPGFAPLTINDGDAASGGDGGLLWWDGSAWQAGGTPIEFSADSPSGVLTYTAATDTWATNTASFVPSSLDGGTFTGSFVAPAFSAGYAPTIGDA